MAISLFAHAPADAQFDHQRCFKVKDNAKFVAEVNLSALQTQFGVDESCSIIGKAKLFSARP